MLLPFDTWPEVRRDALEGLMAEIADRAGLEAARWLVMHFGDTAITVPRRLPVRQGGEITGPLGEIARDHSVGLARALVELRGGESIRIPAPQPIHLASVREPIRQLYDGRNAGTLARRFQVSRRYVKAVALERE